MPNAEVAANRVAFLRRLRAVRQFLPTPVPDEVVNDILEVARWSGSANNRQPWELVVIRDRETLRGLGGLEGYARHVANAPLAIVLVLEGERPEHEAYDEGRLSERIMLAALAHGLGSCIGWFNGAGIAAAKELLGVPAERRLRTAISIGYPDREALRARPRREQPRKPRADIVRWEQYR